MADTFKSIGFHATLILNRLRCEMKVRDLNSLHDHAERNAEKTGETAADENERDVVEEFRKVRAGLKRLKHVREAILPQQQFSFVDV